MTEESSAQVSPPAAPPAPPSRLILWFRRAMIWVAGVMVIFALGALGNWWFQVRPRAAQVQQLTTQLGEAEQELGTLRPKATEADQLRASLDQAEVRLLWLQALAQVQAARVALAQGQGSDARAPALKADVFLARLQSQLGPTSGDPIGAMRDRLRMAIDELKGNAFAADRDLEIMANYLEFGNLP